MLPNHIFISRYAAIRHPSRTQSSKMKNTPQQFMVSAPKHDRPGAVCRFGCPSFREPGRLTNVFGHTRVQMLNHGQSKCSAVGPNAQHNSLIPRRSMLSGGSCSETILQPFSVFKCYDRKTNSKQHCTACHLANSCSISSRQFVLYWFELFMRGGLAGIHYSD